MLYNKVQGDEMLVDGASGVCWLQSASTAAGNMVATTCLVVLNCPSTTQIEHSYQAYSATRMVHTQQCCVAVFTLAAHLYNT
jgi:hypothetical protein